PPDSLHFGATFFPPPVVFSSQGRVSMAEELVPPKHLYELIGSNSAEHFIKLGQHFFDLFVKYADLKPSDRVLDVGCGCGRMAVPLTKFLTEGSYEGFDIVPELIDWCKDTITPKFPKFQFQMM